MRVTFEDQAKKLLSSHTIPVEEPALSQENYPFYRERGCLLKK
jgi:hypothetical protein